MSTDTADDELETYPPRQIILDLLHAVRSVEQTDGSWLEKPLRVHIDAATEKLEIWALTKAIAAKPSHEVPMHGDGWDKWSDGHLTGHNSAINEYEANLRAKFGATE